MYGTIQPNVPDTITEEPSPMDSGLNTPDPNSGTQKVKRTPRDIYRVHESENAPLIPKSNDSGDEEQLAVPRRS